MGRLVPLTLFSACLGLMGLWRWLVSPAKPLPRAWTYAGFAPLAVGGLCALAGLVHLMRAGTTTSAFGKPSRLVTGGIFRISRNPIYLGLAMMLLGGAILMGGGWELLGVALFVLVADRWIIRPEEKKLSAGFGKEFDEYRKRTRRWI